MTSVLPVCLEGVLDVPARTSSPAPPPDVESPLPSPCSASRLAPPCPWMSRSPSPNGLSSAFPWNPSWVRVIPCGHLRALVRGCDWRPELCSCPVSALPRWNRSRAEERGLHSGRGHVRQPGCTTGDVHESRSPAPRGDEGPVLTCASMASRSDAGGGGCDFSLPLGLSPRVRRALIAQRGLKDRRPQEDGFQELQLIFAPAGPWEFPAGLGQRGYGEREGESVPWGDGLGHRAWGPRVPACALLRWELGGAASRGERGPRQGAFLLPP